MLSIFPGPRNRAQNWTQIRFPKHNPGRQISYKDANKDVQTWSSVSSLRGDLSHLWTTSAKKEGNLDRRSCSNKDNIFTFTSQAWSRHALLQKTQTEVPRVGKWTACSLLWGYVHGSPENGLFCGPGFGTLFCSNIASASCYSLASLENCGGPNERDWNMSNFEGLELGTSVRAYFGALSHLMASLMDNIYWKAYLLVASITAILRSVFQIV